MKISICIPTYNGEKYLADTLESVIGQTFTAVEILVNDDCSTDGTLGIAQRYADKDSRIIVTVNERNLGLVGNWNKTIEQAKGTYIKLMCQDDLLSPDCLCLQNEALDAHPDVELVTSASYIIDSSNRRYFLRKLANQSVVLPGLAIGKKSLASGKNLFGEPSLILYRTAMLKEIGNYNDAYKYVPDWDFSLRLLTKGSLCFLCEPLASFRVSTTSETGRLFRKKNLDTIREEYAFYDTYCKTGLFGLNAVHRFTHHVQILIRAAAKYFFIKYVLRSA